MIITWLRWLVVPAAGHRAGVSGQSVASASVSRQKVIYEILRTDTGEVLGHHRTRQAAVDAWRRWAGVPVRITRWPRRSDGPGVLIVEGTWHETKRPDAADPDDD